MLILRSSLKFSFYCTWPLVYVCNERREIFFYFFDVFKFCDDGTGGLGAEFIVEEFFFSFQIELESMPSSTAEQNRKTPIDPFQRDAAIWLSMPGPPTMEKRDPRC